MKLKPGLIKYRVEFGAESRRHARRCCTRVGNLVCGDAYLIDGQSNAVATDVGKEDPPLHQRLDSQLSAACPAARNGRSAEALGQRRRAETATAGRSRSATGAWNWRSGSWRARRCRSASSTAPWAARASTSTSGTRPIPRTWRRSTAGCSGGCGRRRLTHGIRGVLWHQGENDQGADGPTGGYGWETYQQYFIDMAAAWKQDYPNIQHYYVFQIWPKACAWAINGSDNGCARCSGRCRRVFAT